MGIRLHKFVIFITLVLLTLASLDLFIVVYKDIESIKHRNRGYIDNHIINEMRQVQDEFMSIFEVYLEKSRTLINNKQDLIEVKKNLDLEYIEYIGLITLDEGVNYYSIYQNGYKPDQGLTTIMNQINFFRLQEYIKSDNQHRYFFFPIIDNEYKINEWLLITVALERFIDDKLIELSKSLLKEGYKLETVLGKDLHLKMIKKSDAIFNIDEIFMMKSRWDYLKRIESVKFESESIIKNDDLYITVSLISGSIEEQFNMKRNIYFTAIILLYLFIISLILYITLTHINLKRSSLREKEFAALISHELKTPLSVILLGGENLKSGVIQDVEGIEYYGGLIVKEAIKLKKMIESILSLATIDNKANSVVLHPEVCVSMVEETLENLAIKIETQQIIINKKFNYLDGTLYCHRSSIISCLQNIIENGIIYGASKSINRVLDISIKEMKKGRKEGVAFIIQDYGPGIPAVDVKGIFKSFHRSKSSINEQIPGTGLGLSISRKVLTKFGGSLTLYDSFKMGATFEIWLPKLDI